jgi:hypothetical protein
MRYFVQARLLELLSNDPGNDSKARQGYTAIETAENSRKGELTDFSIKLARIAFSSGSTERY